MYAFAHDTWVLSACHLPRMQGKIGVGKPGMSSPKFGGFCTGHQMSENVTRQRLEGKSEG